MPKSESPNSDHDVLVIGAGPAGVEAAIAAAGGGARTLCLTINLDGAGFHPANPVLIADREDPRNLLLAELAAMGASLPLLLSREGISVSRSFDGRLTIDRRLLGLAYKERLESTAGVETRQSLVTSIEPVLNGWQVSTRLDEVFNVAAVVVAAGTFINGIVRDAGVTTPGGRRGEIPSHALAKSLQKLGIDLVRTRASTAPRLADGLVETQGQSASLHRGQLPRDGSQLFESYGDEYLQSITGNRIEQLRSVRGKPGLASAWMTRPSYQVDHEIIAAGQVETSLESTIHDGLFFAGRFAGCCNFMEAAALGLISGTRAAVRAASISGKASSKREAASPAELIPGESLTNRLCHKVAHERERPVTVRIDGPGC